MSTPYETVIPRAAARKHRQLKPSFRCAGDLLLRLVAVHKGKTDPPLRCEAPRIEAASGRSEG